MAQDGVYVFPDAGTSAGRSGVDPNLLLALNQTGGFGGGAGWLWPMLYYAFLKRSCWIYLRIPSGAGF